MRKLLPLLLLPVFLCACSEQVNDEPQTKTGTFSGQTIPIAQSGWDIFDGPAYRYGPSIIINEDGSIDAWFAAPGGVYGDYISLYDEAAVNSPVSLGSVNTAAQRFSSNQPFYAIGAQCPNWGGSPAALTLTLYQWNANYQTTVAGTPIASKQFVNYRDNDWLNLTSANKFPAGEYLWVLNNGTTPQSGVWKQGGDQPGITNYLNGQQSSGCYKGRIMLNPSSGGAYWDQASYQHSTDGGRTWTKEKMVLKPTEGSRDAFSVCDPGVAKWGGYYYIGYTSTENAAGLDNHAYICRGTSPEGPWEKWNGTGWGGNPQPIIEYTGDPNTFGAGEPSIVVLNNTVYFYYTWNDAGSETTTTRLATASATDLNWPANLTHHGTVINKSHMSAADHCDVKYRDDLQKFQAIHTASRITSDSYIMLWESTDGIHFEQIGRLTGDMRPYLHNCGWSGDAKGHINPQVQQYVSYAYGSATAPWGQWKTGWAPLTF